MRAVITVAGKDRVGIIASVTQTLAQQNVNVLDITQTILPPDFFTMVMLVDCAQIGLPFAELVALMEGQGKEHNLSIHIQREDIFIKMHRI